MLLSNSSWTTITLVAVGWSAACLLVMGVDFWHSLRSFAGPSKQVSGGLAAIGFEMTLQGAIVAFGPPVVVMALRAVAARVSRR